MVVEVVVVEVVVAEVVVVKMGVVANLWSTPRRILAGDGVSALATEDRELSLQLIGDVFRQHNVTRLDRVGRWLERVVGEEARMGWLQMRRLWRICVVVVGWLEVVEGLVGKVEWRLLGWREELVRVWGV